jgi:hypothetical protein
MPLLQTKPLKTFLRRLSAIVALAFVFGIAMSVLASDADAHAGHKPANNAVGEIAFGSAAPLGESHQTDCCHKGALGVACQSISTGAPGVASLLMPLFAGSCDWAKRVRRLTGVIFPPPNPPPKSVIT